MKILIASRAVGRELAPLVLMGVPPPASWGMGTAVSLSPTTRTMTTDKAPIGSLRRWVGVALALGKGALLNPASSKGTNVGVMMVINGVYSWKYSTAGFICYLYVLSFSVNSGNKLPDILR